MLTNNQNNLPIMPNELHIMASMASFYTIYTNSISVCGVACSTPVKQKYTSLNKQAYNAI